MSKKELPESLSYLLNSYTFLNQELPIVERLKGGSCKEYLHKDYLKALHKVDGYFSKYYPPISTGGNNYRQWCDFIRIIVRSVLVRILNNLNTDSGRT